MPFFSLKYQNKALFGPKFKCFSFFRKILHLDKLEGADFKYDNTVFKFHPKSTQFREFLSQIYGFFMKFCH